MDYKLQAFDRLLTIMDELREKCPWDKKQTLQSLRHLTIEETYELADAIIEEDLDEIKEEIGDIMLHMVFYAKIASEKKAFDIAEHYRRLGGYKITLSEDMFKADIQVCRLPDSAIQGNYRRVNP